MELMSNSKVYPPFIYIPYWRYMYLCCQSFNKTRVTSPLMDWVRLSLRSNFSKLCFYKIVFDRVMHSRPANTFVQFSTAGEISEASWVAQYLHDCIRHLSVAGLRRQLFCCHCSIWLASYQVNYMQLVAHLVFKCLDLPK